MNKFLNSSLFTLILALLTVGNAFGMKTPPAGILPYVVNKEGKVLFLIGHEQVWWTDKATNTQKTAMVWTDFGGNGEAGETPDQTALREFSEETRGSYGLLMPDGATTVEKSQAYLNGRIKPEHIFLINGKNPYSMFLVEVDYINPKDILALPSDEHTEKDDYQWVDAQALLACIEKAPDKANIVFLENMPLRFMFGILLHKNISQFKQFVQEVRQSAQLQTMIPLPGLKKTKSTVPVTEKAGAAALLVDPKAYALTALAVVLSGYAVYRWLNPKDEVDDEAQEGDVTPEKVKVIQ